MCLALQGNKVWIQVKVSSLGDNTNNIVSAVDEQTAVCFELTRNFEGLVSFPPYGQPCTIVVMMKLMRIIAMVQVLKKMKRRTFLIDCDVRPSNTTTLEQKLTLQRPTQVLRALRGFSIFLPIIHALLELLFAHLQWLVFEFQINLPVFVQAIIIS